MEEFINYLKTQYRYKEQTLQMKIRELNSWKSLCTKHQKLDKLTTSEILQMVEIKKNSYQNQVINRHLQTLEDYYYYLIQAKKRKDHPIKGFRIKTQQRGIIQKFYTQEELHKIYENYPDKGHQKGQFDLYAQRNKIMMGLIIYQALDCGSLASLQVKDIDLQKAKIHIPAKTIDLLNSRTLPLESIQILPLKDYIENTRPAILKLLNLQNDYLFPYSQQIQVKRLIVSIHKKIKTYHNIKEFKDLRQSRIALWLKQYEIRTVQYKTGFKKLQSFEKYKKTQIESLQEAINKYHIF